MTHFRGVAYSSSSFTQSPRLVFCRRILNILLCSVGLAVYQAPDDTSPSLFCVWKRQSRNYVPAFRSISLRLWGCGC
ncbi:hypothetical protein B0H14DRAFT_2682484 [Mycena olivaceomarginata]|nr:hypothetical protein B0H14DRAFT_2682484 [Mycena olivaceomarginata]